MAKTLFDTVIGRGQSDVMVFEIHKDTIAALRAAVNG
jgi:hypothetical protein